MYQILLVPLAAGFIAQTIKFFIASNHQKFSLKNLAAYSGMPSGHTAIVISLAVSTGLNLGWHDPVFAITVVLAIVVIRDALGIRRYLGEHGRTLNKLVNDLSDDNVLEDRYPHLLERIGHTPTQVLVGGLIGTSLSLLVYYIL